MTFLLGRARTDVVDRKTQSETRATVRADTEVQTRAGCEGGGHHEPWRDVHAGHVFAMGVIDDREDSLSAGIPDLQCSVKASADNSLSIRTEGDTQDLARVSCERLQHLACLGIPDSHGRVAATTDNSLPVGAEGDAHNRFGVPFERLQHLACRGIPGLTCTVTAATDQSLLIRAVGNAQDEVRVSFERLQCLTGFRIPDFQCPVATTDDSLPIGIEGDTTDSAGFCPCKCRDCRAGAGIPDL